MNDKRHIYRGFHPDENGDTVITLNGEKIRGEWVYGYIDKFRNIRNEVYTAIIQICDNETKECSLHGLVAILPETVGQWVTTDKNDKDVFEDDIVIVQSSNNGYYPFSRETIITFNSENLKYLFGFSMGDVDIIERIGNRWEVQE